MRMWSLQSLLLPLCMSLSCVRGELIHAYGYEGSSAQVSCPYPAGYESYDKYLCRNDCGSGDVLIITTEAQKNRFSISDNRQQRVFTATISGLSRSDAGKYWCGVSRSGKDIYTEVKLEVEQDSCCDDSTKVQYYEESSASLTCPYESEYQNSLKFVCGGSRRSSCLQQAKVTSTSQHVGQFRLTDDKRLKRFTVTISSLTQRNSGRYLCGVRANSGLDLFAAFDLEVKAWCCVASRKLTGSVGRPVTLQCPYPPEHRDNRKFLCKGEQRRSCTDMVTSQSRFTLQDDVSSSSFSVTITRLKAEDAGTYWCGSDPQWAAANYIKIQLSAGASKG
ncbi:polymeric immunoglobulin receptor-like [Centropristis striata]|uniref:polymeric immunoglobulin receptor-like n=1 Tax=Centropristis striata TaxID=184440 RepID=UPI0027DFA994|nr:polymeric immunoglobulin receptor-like [Centropristis striata]